MATLKAKLAALGDAALADVVKSVTPHAKHHAQAYGNPDYGF